MYYIVITFVLQLGLSTTDLKLFSAAIVAIALAIPTIRQKIVQRRALRVGTNGR